MIPCYLARSNLSRCQDWASEKEIKVTYCWQEEETFQFSPLSGQWGSRHLGSDTDTNEPSNTLTCAVQGTFGRGHLQSVTDNGVPYWTAVDLMSPVTSPHGLSFWYTLILLRAYKDVALEGVEHVFVLVGVSPFSELLDVFYSAETPPLVLFNTHLTSAIMQVRGNILMRV